MELLEIKLECDQTTLFKNLQNKSGEIDCPACHDHKIDVEQCLSMLINRELMLKKKIELSLEENLKEELMIKLDDQFGNMVNQIDLRCETLIKQIKDYTQDLIDQLQAKKTGLEEQIENIESTGLSKNAFYMELANETTLSNKIKIEKQYEEKINERKQFFLEKLKVFDYYLKTPETNIEELVGSLELKDIDKIEKVITEKENDDYVEDFLNQHQSALISLKSKANNKFVCADFFGIAPLNANKNVVGRWEKFVLIKNIDGTVSFKLNFNKKYVRACKKGSGFLLAKSLEIGDKEKFKLETNRDGSFSFRALVNNKLVMPNDGESGYLIAKGDVVNDHQRFFIQILNFNHFSQFNLN